MSLFWQGVFLLFAMADGAAAGYFVGKERKVAQ
jgi:hypothetical protein